jgi:hypothetical protein
MGRQSADGCLNALPKLSEDFTGDPCRPQLEPIDISHAESRTSVRGAICKEEPLRTVPVHAVGSLS